MGFWPTLVSNGFGRGEDESMFWFSVTKREPIIPLTRPAGWKMCGCGGKDRNNRKVSHGAGGWRVTNRPGLDDR